MAIISDVKRFKEIDNTDNILVKEIDLFKKSNFPEIANTLIKYIDIETLIEEALAQRNVFFDNFLARGVYPFLRMACDVEVLSLADKTVRLIQRPLSINSKLRYENIDVKYFDNAILEVYIESLPPEVTDRSEWRLESIDTPLDIKIRRREAEVEEESYFYLSEITFDKPIKFALYNFALIQTWSPILDIFAGRVEAYGATTGVDGYQDFTPFEKDAYLRYVSSMVELSVLPENVSRGKNISLRDNNITRKLYVEENPNAAPSRQTKGSDIEFGASTVPRGKGVDNLGCKVIIKEEPSEIALYRSGSQDIGTIKASYVKRHFGLKEFEDTRFICASPDSDKVYNTLDYPIFANKFGISSPTFSVRDYVYRISNPFNLPAYKFKDYGLSHTTKAQEFGQVNPGKIGVSFAGNSVAGTNGERLKDVISSDVDDFLISGRVVVGGSEATFDPVRVRTWTGPEDGDYAEVIPENFYQDQTYIDVPSKYKKRTSPLSVYNDFTGNQMGVKKTNRKPDIGVVFYVPIGFKNPLNNNKTKSKA